MKKDHSKLLDQAAGVLSGGPPALNKKVRVLLQEIYDTGFLAGREDAQEELIREMQRRTK